MAISELLSQPPIGREGLAGLEAARLLGDPIFRGLRRTGHCTSCAGVRFDADY